jgi:putative membrane protein
MGFLARTAITAFGLWLADLLLPGLWFEGFWPLVLAAILLGIVNAIVRPIVIILTLPITFVTLGFFLLVINGAMVLLVGRLMPSVHMAGLGTGILTAIIVGLTGLIANRYVGGRPTVVVHKSG